MARQSWSDGGDNPEFFRLFGIVLVNSVTGTKSAGTTSAEDLNPDETLVVAVRFRLPWRSCLSRCSKISVMSKLLRPPRRLKTSNLSGLAFCCLPSCEVDRKGEELSALDRNSIPGDVVLRLFFLGSDVRRPFNSHGGRNGADDSLNPPRDLKQARVATGARIDLDTDRQIIRG